MSRRSIAVIARLPVLACGALVLSLVAFTPRPQDTPFPEGYRRWVHVKTGVVPAGNPAAGMHLIYANPEAVEGYRRGRFPDGAVLVFDRLTAVTDERGTRAGARLAVDVMRKDSVRFASTGGWEFVEFQGDDRTAPAVSGASAVGACFGCHSRQADRDYVFSAFQD